MVSSIFSLVKAKTLLGARSKGRSWTFAPVIGHFSLNSARISSEFVLLALLPLLLLPIMYAETEESDIEVRVAVGNEEYDLPRSHETKAERTDSGRESQASITDGESLCSLE